MVLLIMATMMTIGVGAVARSTNDLRITRQEVEASIALNAAEAGIEQALSQISSGTIPSGMQTISVGNQSVSYTIEELSSIDAVVAENEVIDVFLGAGGNAGTLTINWESVDGTTCPGLVVKIYSQSPGAQVSTYGYKRCATADDVSGTFTEVASPGVLTVNVAANDRFVRLRPVFSAADIEVSSNNFPLPVQSYRVVSTGTNPEGGETKVIELTRTRPRLPALFDYSFWSQAGVQI